jgi:cold shock CspA family protein
MNAINQCFKFDMPIFIINMCLMFKEPRQLVNEDFGVIVSVKENFGFIQPFVKEEQVFFSFNDLRYTTGAPAIGDEVCFRERSGPRGPIAQNVRPVSQQNVKVVRSKVTGVVIREPDAHRSASVGSGCVQVTSERNLPSEIEIPEFVAFIMGDTGSGSRLTRVVKGDEVQFDLSYMEGTNYFIGKGGVLIRTKKQKQLAIQTQRMLDAGVRREVGVIESMHGDYGFIKPQDRREQVYFRTDDVVDAEHAPLAVIFFNLNE